MGRRMLNLSGKVKIYIAPGLTDMRKGVQGLSVLAQDNLLQNVTDGSMFIFRGKRSDKIKIIWFDGQGFCLFYKCLERGKFIWPNVNSEGVIGITGAQLSMLLEGIDWRNPTWSSPPERLC